MNNSETYSRRPHPEINFDISCNSCSLGKYNKATSTSCVRGCGPDDLNRIRLIIISDHPGYFEKQKGYVFHDNQKTGKYETQNDWLNAGSLIRQTLTHLGLNSYLDCWMTNVIKCEPGKNTILDSHINTCINHLVEEINVLDKYVPNVPILIAGNKAFKGIKKITPQLLKSNLELNDCRRTNHYTYKNHPLIFTYNPAAICKCQMRLEKTVYYHNDYIYIPDKQIYPILPGSPYWHWLKDIEFISPFLNKTS